MAKYLDYDGLGYLWEKITKYVNSQINTNESFPFETVALTLTDWLGGGLNNRNRYL